VPADTQAALVMRSAWLRFVSKFTERCDEMEALASRYHEQDGASAAELAGELHRVAGLAGAIGFPRVGRWASEAESLLASSRGETGAQLVREILPMLRETFAAELATTVAPGSGKPAAAPAVRLTVCIVEDDPEQLALLSHQVEFAGHEVMALASADDLLTTVRKRRPSVILLDVNMPGLSGYEACQMLKSEPDLAGIPVLFTTARAGAGDRVTGLALGADDYLCKPFDVSELLLRLKRCAARGDA
jgi:CheY-like chemotaxis protein